MNTLSLLLPPLLVGLTVSCLFDPLLTPRPKPFWQRAPSTVLLHVGSWLLLFVLLLALFQRPWFAVVMLCAFQLLLVLVNHAKYDSLREPFLFQDFEYFTDAIKHPRLYLPFFGMGRTVAATVGFVGAFTVGLWLETPLTALMPVPPLLAVWLLSGITSLLLIKRGLSRCPPISCDPAHDLHALGQSAFFWAYWHAEKSSDINCAESPFNCLKATEKRTLPHIVAVQSESFFDARRLSDSIRPAVLAHFDHIKSQATYHGRLQVPAWGANTVRTECGFLTGLTPEQLGIHRFNPYRWLARHTVPNLAAHYRQLGYHTVCIHPYPASFYQRDQVFPRLGFDQFLDINNFDAQQKWGQYTGDKAVADTVCKLLQACQEKPLFVFVITMENHGPLHLEQAKATDSDTLYRHLPPPNCDDLTVYLGHLHNADLMLKQLQDSLQAGCPRVDNASGREGVLCWYGDHVPIMTGVYQQLGEPDGDTEYFIWQTNAKNSLHASIESRIAVNELTALLLQLG